MGQRPARDVNQAPKHNTQHKPSKSGSVHGAVNGITNSTIWNSGWKLMIDTGSTISIVHPEMLTLQPSTSLVTGDTAPIQGCGQVQMGIGNLLVPHELWVADITDSAFLD